MLPPNARLLFASLAALISLNGCVKEVDLTSEKKAENAARIKQYLAVNNLTAKDTLGVSFVLTQPNPGGLQPKAGDSVLVHFVASTLEGQRLDSTSVTNNQPFKYWFQVSLDPRVLPGFTRGVALMRQGEKAIVLVPSDLAFGSLGDPQRFPAYSPLRFDFHLVDVITEDKRIDKYLADNNLASQFETAPSGFRFRLNQAVPDSARADSGKTASVRYTGRFLNGRQFQSIGSGTASPEPVVVKINNLPRGFNEGISRMRKGEKATIIFPSSLGYGAAGTQQQTYTVLPYQPLIYEVEVVDVK